MALLPLFVEVRYFDQLVPRQAKAEGDGLYVRQNLSSALSCMTKTQLELVCFKGRAKMIPVLSSFDRDIWFGLKLIVYHPDQAI